MASDTSSAAVLLLLFLRLGVSLQVCCWATFPIPKKRVNLGKGSSLGAFFLMGWGGGDEIGTIVISYTFIFLDRGWGEISFHQFVG